MTSLSTRLIATSLTEKERCYQLKRRRALMKRKVHCRAMYFVFTMFFCLTLIGLSSVNSEAGDSICAGQWNMVANKDFAFILRISQPTGAKIFGSMTRTDGSEPVDRIDGYCHSDGTITFTRVRKGQWQQHYRGKVSRADFMSGSFTDDNGRYRWTARR